jgi:hypothetical protein
MRLARTIPKLIAGGKLRKLRCYFNRLCKTHRMGDERCGLVTSAAGARESVSCGAPRLRGVAARRRLWFRAVMGVLLLLAGITNLRAGAQSEPTTKDVAGQGLLSIPPRSWVVDAAKNELIALHHTDSYLRYRTHTISEKGDVVRDVIESKDGTVARLIMKDGKPLAEEQDKNERQRLNDMIASPTAYFKHVRNGESQQKLADAMVPLMPDAALYSYTPGQPQSGKNGGALEIVIDYKPNPKFNPPSTEAEALTGLQGRIWIDAKTRYLVRMEGTIAHAVNFGWGMLAHIYPGGKLSLEQTSVGSNRWIFTNFSMQLNVRALMVKTLNVRTNSSASGFQVIAPMSYQDAIRLTLDTPLPK